MRKVFLWNLRKRDERKHSPTGLARTSDTQVQYKYHVNHANHVPVY